LKTKPKILLTIGDPNGIGPEIILKIFRNKKLFQKYNLKIIGTKKVLDFYSDLLKIKKINQKDIIELSAYKNFKTNIGKTDAVAGRMSGDAIRFGAERCKQKEFDAIVTLPISKEALNAGGYNFPGHTEFLTSLTNSKATVMIMYSNRVIISPLTTHIPLKDVSKILTKSYLMKRLFTINDVLRNEFSIKNPSIAVLSLNPHCSDAGLTGNEENNTIKPVIKELWRKKIRVYGPFSPDSYFGNNNYENFTITMSMYHDQGLIPFKMLSSINGVNYTGGLNITRTSPVHGTGFDISGKGVANHVSTLAAIRLACKLVKLKQK
jgi:4-hydroxythreonine-4-phosphate dehydrogenase